MSDFENDLGRISHTSEILGTEETVLDTIQDMIETAQLEAKVSAEYMKRNTNPNLKDFHVTLGPKAKNLSVEELMQHLQEVEVAVRKQQSEWDAKSEVEKLKWNLDRAVQALDAIVKQTQHSIRDFVDDKVDSQARLSKIFGIVDMVQIELRDTETFSMRDRL